MIIVVPQPRQLAQTGLLFGVNGASSLWRVPPLAPRRTLDRFVAIAEAPDHWLAWLGPPQLEARAGKRFSVTCRLHLMWDQMTGWDRYY